MSSCMHCFEFLWRHCAALYTDILFCIYSFTACCSYYIANIHYADNCQMTQINLTLFQVHYINVQLMFMLKPNAREIYQYNNPWYSNHPSTSPASHRVMESELVIYCSNLLNLCCGGSATACPLYRLLTSFTVPLTEIFYFGEEAFVPLCRENAL